MRYFEALREMELGEAVARRSWTLSDKWVKLDPGSTDAGRGIQPKFMYYMDASHNKQVFEPTSEDQMAEDWYVFGKDEPIEDDGDVEVDEFGNELPADHEADVDASDDAVVDDSDDDHVYDVFSDDGGSDNVDQDELHATEGAPLEKDK